ncbi:MAG: Holliday junction resolvase RuvX [Candidatus Neomarinimicrobiota bacterium]|jgi:putative Holliday junction resolvase|nr:Holliday junction resolvase RuvX [Candidatus Neomarinimicrobiota bacterium]|tara:strand:+ start:126 stop:533 length:408 start_codon:yes stop_codon:yes gene_type:complete
MGRLLAIDYGARRVGLALSDPLKMIASPYRTIINKNNTILIEEIERIIAAEDVELTIMGLPLGMAGQKTEQTKKVEEFVDKLTDRGIIIKYEDERWSSVAAKRSMKEQNIKSGYNKDLVDQTAAAIFLQQYLDRH